jgi:hypothetical protein
MPRGGDLLAKVRTLRNGVRIVDSRKVIARQGRMVMYTRRVRWVRCTLESWRSWARDAERVPQSFGPRRRDTHARPR